MTMSKLLNPEEQLQKTPELSQPSTTIHDSTVRLKNDKVGRLQRIRRRISASLGRLTVIKDEPTQELLASEGSLYDSQARSTHQHINPGLESRSLTCLVNLQENEIGNDFLTHSEVQHSPLETHVYQAKASHFMPSLKRYWSVNEDITQAPTGDAGLFKSRLHRPFSECTFEGTLKRYSSVDSPFGKVESYKKLERLGEGSYATVYKGMSSMNKQIVALKEIRLQEEEGAPFTAIREASLLKGLKHANIVTLIDILHTKETLTFVFEYVSTDLSQYLEKYPGGLNPHNVKLFLYQLLRGLDFCHQRRILHRDIKPQNLLISNIGELKLADFGLARAKSVPSRTYSHEVVTLWYRPPDVLLGSTKYSTSLDMWGVGCIFMEMLSGQAIFPGMKDIYDQLNKIFRVLGTPTEDSWEGVSSYPNYNIDKFNRHHSRRLILVYPKLLDVPYAENLASSFLQLDPKKRISAKDAKLYPYFSDLPVKVHDLPPAASVFVLPGVKLVPEGSHKVTTRSATKVLL